MKTIIKLSTLFILLFSNLEVMACDVCEKQQPKVLRGVTHGAGPQSDWDYAIVWAIVSVVLISLFFSIKWMLNPGEKESEHIKRSIFKPH